MRGLRVGVMLIGSMKRHGSRKKYYAKRSQVMTANGFQQGQPTVVAVCISDGGVPKWPLRSTTVTPAGLEGDSHAHAKHNRPDRAISIFDLESMEELVTEGFPLQPGSAGENITVQNLGVQQMDPGTVLEIGEVWLRLEKPRKPCYVLDVIDPRLKESIVGRCGYMASVVRGGTIRPGMPIRCLKTECYAKQK